MKSKQPPKCPRCGDTLVLTWAYGDWLLKCVCCGYDRVGDK